MTVSAIAKTRRQYAPVKYVAANDNVPVPHKQCLACECFLPLERFSRHATGGMGVSAECKECRAITRAKRGREAEYEIRNAVRGGLSKRERGVVNRRKRLITKWRKSAVGARLATINRVAKYVDRFYLVQQKPWLAVGLTKGESNKLRRKHDTAFLLRDRTRSRLRRKGLKGNALKAMRQALNAKYGNVRRAGLEGLLGFSIDELRAHLEMQFTDGMSWDCFRRGEIHIDHIRPLNTYDDLMDAEQAEAAWAISNLRPLWAKDNMSRPRDGSDVNWKALAANDNAKGARAA